MIAFLYAAAMLVLLLFGLNMLWLAIHHARLDFYEPDTRDDGFEPYVTIQLPLYNESLVAARLIDACARLDYPREKIEIQVLDDSTDETVEIVSRKVEEWRGKHIDIQHIRRLDRQGYKAGALQHGLAFARGDFILIFDADFLPDADYLRRLLPAFRNPNVGMVQARWGHLNGDESLLTRLQAFGLDMHFAIEQRVRNLTGCFITFNGTAGIWRRSCIDDAGGWQADTLTEDLDLSYRAQLKGWKFKFVPDVEVPAEVPADMNGFRIQQFRWTKGAVQTAMKLLPRLWKSTESLKIKTEGTMQLTAHLVFPFILIVALLHAPLLYLKNTVGAPAELYFGIMGLGLIGFAGFFVANVFSQRVLYPDWPSRLSVFPVFLAGTMGLAASNMVAISQALRGKQTAFVRTPKYSSTGVSRWAQSKYASRKVPSIAWVELILALYCLVGAGVIIYFREWAALPFQLLFLGGFLLITVFNFRQFRGD